MRNIFTLVICLLLFVTAASAQREAYIWPWNGGMIDFNTTAPTYTEGGMFDVFRGTAICGSNGALLFYADTRTIYNKTKAPMPYGLLKNHDGINRVAIARDPSDKNRYYVFSLSVPYQGDTAALYYSIVDMRLRNGLGDVLPDKRNILVDSNLTPGGLTVIRGNNCNVWILVHTKIENKFRTIELTAGGLNTNPVISPGGTVIPAFGIGGHDATTCSIKANSVNNKIAFGVTQYNGGLSGSAGAAILELYDFDNATGQLSNFTSLINNPGFAKAVMGICFSPDNSKLYYSCKPNPSLGALGVCWVSQFDLSLATTAAVIASETMISGIVPIGNDLKAGPDGRIYISVKYPGGISLFYGGGGTYYINQPNLPGIACQFVSNDIQFQITTPGSTTNYGDDFPGDIVVLPRDTVTSTQHIIVCSADSVQLPVDITGTNYTWWDGTAAPSKVVKTSGTYYVQYQTGCTDRLDTFLVAFQKLPLVSWDSISCEGEKTGNAFALVQDSTLTTLTWGNSDGIFSTKQTRTGDTAGGLNPGDYFVRINTAAGCDTTIHFHILSYPEMQLTVNPNEAILRYGDSIQLRASGALYYTWWPSGSVSNDTSASPFVKPLQPVVYTVLGLDEYGCRDTAMVNINIDYAMPQLIPNAFSPNGDGRNDVFKIEGITYQKLVTFCVFNRFGQLVFENGDPNKGWDGRHKNIPCEMGTYYYIIRLNYPDGAMKTFKGDVLLIR